MIGPVTEAEWQDLVAGTARSYGWKVIHAGVSQRGGSYTTALDYDGTGFPDLVLFHRAYGQVTFAELKVGAGDLTEHQETWADLLEQIEQTQTERNGTPGIAYYVWRPEHWTAIRDYLAGRRNP